MRAGCSIECEENDAGECDACERRTAHLAEVAMDWADWFNEARDMADAEGIVLDADTKEKLRKAWRVGKNPDEALVELIEF